LDCQEEPAVPIGNAHAAKKLRRVAGGTLVSAGFRVIVPRDRES